MPGDEVEELARIVAYVWHLGDLCRVRPLWELRVTVEDVVDGDEETDARVEPTPGRYHAHITIKQEVVNEGGDRLRYDVTHELIHLYHRDQADSIRFPLVPALSHQAYSILWEGFDQATELMVDRLATLIAPFMPTYEEWIPSVV